MSIEKCTEFFKRFNFPENIQFEYDGKTGCVANDIAVRMAEKWEDFVVEQIVAEAIDMGISDLTVLNKHAIMNALRKQIPQKPVDIAGNALYGRCAACRNIAHIGMRYCDNCGQAIEWEDEQ